MSDRTTLRERFRQWVRGASKPPATETCNETALPDSSKGVRFKREDNLETRGRAALALADGQIVTEFAQIHFNVMLTSKKEHKMVFEKTNYRASKDFNTEDVEFLVFDAGGGVFPVRMKFNEPHYYVRIGDILTVDDCGLCFTSAL